jgi:hypothetical protein
MRCYVTFLFKKDNTICRRGAGRFERFKIRR